MKFQLKALVAALALAAAALPAQAAMTKTDSGASSLVLTLIDNTNNISATFDLGFSYSTFSTLVSTALTNGGSFSWDLASLPNYSDAWTTFTTTGGNVNLAQWAVFAGDNVGSGAGTTGMITTYKTGSNLSLTTQLTASLGAFDTYISGNNAPGVGNHASVADGASTSTSGASFAGAAKAYGTTGRVNNSGFDATELLGSSMTIRQVLSGATSTSAISASTLGNTQGNYTFTMSKAGVLTLAVPVPEADTYAMLLAGLGLVGFAARRRNAK